MTDISQKTISTPATHYGAGRPSTWNFIVQRATGALNIVFTLFFIWIVVRLAGADAETMGELLGNPVVAVVAALMIISVALHMRVGMREVIEDYVHDEKLNRLCLALNWAVAVAIALLTLGARWTDAELESIYSHSLCHICAYDGGLFVGYVNAAWDGGVHVFLLDPTVHPGHRHRGIGTALLRQTQIFAAERNQRVSIHVETFNPARHLYERLGFKPVAKRDEVYILMEWSPSGGK